MLSVGSRKRLSSCMDEEQENGLPHRLKGVQQDIQQDCEHFMLKHGMQSLLQQPCGQSLSFWWALAELNVTLAAFQHLSQDQTLLESHGFARCLKASAFEKLAFACGCTDMCSLQQQPHLQAVSLCLDTALQSCTEASITRVTLHCPPFLAGWATRWLTCTSSGSVGNGGAVMPPRVRLTILQGYRLAAVLRAATCFNLGLPTITSSPPHVTIYLPDLPHF